MRAVTGTAASPHPLIQLFLEQLLRISSALGLRGTSEMWRAGTVPSSRNLHSNRCHKQALYPCVGCRPHRMISQLCPLLLPHLLCPLLSSKHPDPLAPVPHPYRCLLLVTSENPSRLGNPSPQKAALPFLPSIQSKLLAEPDGFARHTGLSDGHACDQTVPARYKRGCEQIILPS